MPSSTVKKIAEENAQMDMTPMIDVTFQLLIFFMCSLNINTQEGLLVAYLPKDVGIFQQTPVKNPEEPVNIKLLKSQQGTVVWIGETKLIGPNKYEELYSKIKYIIDRTPTAPVIIDPDIETPFEDVIYTLNACRKVGTTKAGKPVEIKFSAKALDASK